MAIETNNDTALPDGVKPVDGGELLDSLRELFSRHLILPEGGAIALALWTLYTWVWEAFPVSPLLAITSPVKRCGKTTLVVLLRYLARDAVTASNITPAALFRYIEEQLPTLLVDEADRFLASSEELIGVLNSGHTKETAEVIRAVRVGSDYKPRRFSTWAPKAIAMIGQLPDTLHDRAIEIRMRRKTVSERVERLRLDQVSAITAPLKQRAKQWAQEHSKELAHADPKVPDYLHDRAADNWRPLLAIAAACGWDTKARDAVRMLSESEDNQDISLMLLGDLRTLFAVEGTDRVATTELIRFLKALEERPWAGHLWPEDSAPYKISQLLKPFGIRPKKFREGESTLRGYLLADCKDAFGRYLDAKLREAA